MSNIFRQITQEEATIVAIESNNQSAPTFVQTSDKEQLISSEKNLILDFSSQSTSCSAGNNCCRVLNIWNANKDRKDPNGGFYKVDLVDYQGELRVGDRVKVTIDSPHVLVIASIFFLFPILLLISSLVVLSTVTFLADKELLIFFIILVILFGYYYLVKIITKSRLKVRVNLI